MVFLRSLFFGLIVVLVIFFSFNARNITISTDLRDLSPKLFSSTDKQKTLDNLSNELQSRFLILLEGADQSSLLASQDFLIQKLQRFTFINSIDSSSIDESIKNISPYKYQLITQKQKTLLDSLDVNTLANDVYIQLHHIDSSLGLIPFTNDPLSYFNQYIAFISNKISGQTINNDKVISVSFIIKKQLDLKTQTELFNEINNIKLIVQKDFSVELSRSGLFFFSAKAGIDSKNELEFISTGSSFCIIALLLIIFRSFRPLLLPSISIFCGVIFALMLNHFFYGSLHILTLIFGISLIGIVVDYSLHFFYHYKNGSKDLSLYKALFLSLLTSLLGYLCLYFSSLDALKKVAVFSCAGLLMSCLCVVAIGSFFTSNSHIFYDNYLSKFIQFFLKSLPVNKNILFYSLSFFILFGFFLINFVKPNISDDPRFFYQVSEQLLQEEQHVSSINMRYEPSQFFIIHDNDSEAIYSHYNELQTTFKEHNISPSLFSLTDIVPSKQEQYNNFLSLDKAYMKDGVIDKLYAQLDIPVPESLYLDYLSKENNYLSINHFLDIFKQTLPLWSEDKLFSNIVLIPIGTDTSQFSKISNKLANVEFINTVKFSELILAKQRLSATYSLFFAFIAIAVLLIVYFRNISCLAMLLVPIFSIFITFLYLVLSNEIITLFHIIAFFLVLGLGMDYVIFVNEMKSNHKQTLNAILLSSITTGISFGFLSLSNIPIANSFGITILLGNSLNFVGTLFYSHYKHS